MKIYYTIFDRVFFHSTMLFAKGKFRSKNSQIIQQTSKSSSMTIIHDVINVKLLSAFYVCNSFNTSSHIILHGTAIIGRSGAITQLPNFVCEFYDTTFSRESQNEQKILSSIQPSPVKKNPKQEIFSTVRHFIFYAFFFSSICNPPPKRPALSFPFQTF